MTALLTASYEGFANRQVEGVCHRFTSQVMGEEARFQEAQEARLQSQPNTKKKPKFPRG